MSLDIANSRPERLNIANLQTGDGYYMQFNPTELKRQTAINYQRHEVIGQSYRPLDYTGTNNQTLSFSVYFRAENRQQQQGMEEVMRFLESLGYPPEDADALVEARPPRCLIVWPNTLSITAVLTNYDETREMFDLQGRTIQATVRLTWEEVSIERLTQERIREQGAQRSTQDWRG